MDAKISGSFEKGASVDVIAGEGDWYKVKFGDGIGYSHRDYLKEAGMFEGIRLGHVDWCMSGRAPR